MKRVVFVLLLCSMFFMVIGQEVPPEWVKYTYGGYFYDIQHDKNVRHLSETAFKQYLLDVARANLAKTVQTRVTEEAIMHKQAVDGQTHVVYSATSRFSTDVDLRFVETAFTYNSQTQEGKALAFINKSTACQYYRNEALMALGKIENAIEVAENYVRNGFPARARAELEGVAVDMEKTDITFFWLSFFGLPKQEMEDLLAQRNRLERQVKQKVSEMIHANRIYLSCAADLYGQPYYKLQNEIKGRLSETGCSWVSDAAQADWVIRVEASARNYNASQIGNITTYFSYVDAQITIDKTVTGQRIFSDEITVKGGHTLNFTEAARAAYKEVSQKIGKVIDNAMNN